MKYDNTCNQLPLANFNAAEKRNMPQECKDRTQIKRLYKL